VPFSASTIADAGTPVSQAQLDSIGNAVAYGSVAYPGDVVVTAPGLVAGVTNGQQIRLKGQGETAQGHRPGDLLITVSIAAHPFFKVDGSDLRLDLPITLYEAVLGGRVRVPTLGSAVELSIPKNTSSGRTFRLKGKGLPKAGGTGDLFVITKIILPDGNDSELEQLMQKWRDGHPYNPRGDLS